jgi:hypothetical protein
MHFVFVQRFWNLVPELYKGKKLDPNRNSIFCNPAGILQSLHFEQTVPCTRGPGPRIISGNFVYSLMFFF